MRAKSSPRSGEMFIATRLSFLISAKSEMASISLFADEVRKPCTFYKHSVPTARLCPNSFARLLLRQSRRTLSFRGAHVIARLTSRERPRLHQKKHPHKSPQQNSHADKTRFRPIDEFDGVFPRRQS